MLCVLEWEAENTDLLRSWRVDHVGTGEEKTIPNKKNKRVLCIPKHRNCSSWYPQKDGLQGRDKANLFFFGGGVYLKFIWMAPLHCDDVRGKGRTTKQNTLGPNSVHTSLPISGMMQITVLHKLQATVWMLKTQKSKHEEKQMYVHQHPGSCLLGGYLWVHALKHDICLAAIIRRELLVQRNISTRRQRIN